MGQKFGVGKQLFAVPRFTRAAPWGFCPNSSAQRAPNSQLPRGVRSGQRYFYWLVLRGATRAPNRPLVSVRGGEMRTRREGASGRRISLALHVFGGLFPSTLADRIFWSSVLTLTTSQHSFMCALQSFVKSRRTLLHIITPPRHSHVSYFARTGCGSI